MTPVSGKGGRRGVLTAAAAAVLLALLGAGAITVGLRSTSPPAPPASAAVTRAAPATAPSPAPARQVSNAAATSVDFGPILPRSLPTSLRIPAIDVSTRGFEKLRKLPDGELAPPKSFDLPGFYAQGPWPGQFGPAVIGGHVDSKAGPAVFWNLGKLKPGDKVYVGRADGTTAVFSVDGVEQYPKDKFPTQRVYANTTNRAELRLITCGGVFNRAIGHYKDNIVAYAHLVGTR